MYLGFNEEGDKCPECHEGTLDWPEVENCHCHINPPCSSCTDQVLVCKECGWEAKPPEYNYVSVAPGLAIKAYRPKPLDNTKIDYRIKMHTGSSQICEGVYPDGTTSKEVIEVVKGTFGGRFAHFGNGEFKYIAYTD